MNAVTPSPQVSHCPNAYSAGQWDSRPENGTPRGTASGTVSLKALAAKVLRASKAGQHVGQARDSPPESVPRWLMAWDSPSRLFRVHKRTSTGHDYARVKRTPPSRPRHPAWTPWRGSRMTRTESWRGWPLNPPSRSGARPSGEGFKSAFEPRPGRG